MIKNTLRYNSGNPESVKNSKSSWKALQLMCPQLPWICWGCSTSCFISDFVFQVISEKYCIGKIYKELEKHIYINITRTIVPVSLLRNLLLPLFRTFVETKNKNQIFEEVGDLVTSMLMLFDYSESRSTSKVCWIQ